MGRRWWSGQWWLSEKHRPTRPSRPTCAKTKHQPHHSHAVSPILADSRRPPTPRLRPVPLGAGRPAADETLTTALRSPDVGSGAAEAGEARVARRSVRGVGASAGSGAAEAGGCTRRPAGARGGRGSCHRQGRGDPRRRRHARGGQGAPAGVASAGSRRSATRRSCVSPRRTDRRLPVAERAPARLRSASPARRPAANRGGAVDGPTRQDGKR